MVEVAHVTLLKAVWSQQNANKMGKRREIKPQMVSSPKAAREDEANIELLKKGLENTT